MTKHTPGPWKIYPGPTIVRVSEDSLSIALISRQRDEWEANARLIAAAPELLTACEAMAAFTRDLLKLVTPEQIKAARLTTRMLKISDQAFNALAKARGES